MEHNMVFGLNNTDLKPNFKISYCIPTYNRAQILDSCLESIVSQPNFTKIAEIVISDNSSTDNTPEIVKKYQSLYPDNIIYNRNDKNEGMEANFLKALELGNGKLLKLLNDYSILTPQALFLFEKAIDDNNNENAIIFFRNELKKKQKTKRCTNFNSFLRDTTYWSTWIGTFSIWRKDFHNIENKEKYVGLLFVHMLLLFENFRRKKLIIINNEHLTNNHPNINFKSGYNFYEIFVENYIGKIVHGLYKSSEINILTLRKIKSKFCTHFLHQEIYKIKNNKSGGLNYIPRNKNSLMKFFRFYPEFYFAPIAIYCRKKTISILKSVGLIKK